MTPLPGRRLLPLALLVAGGTAAAQSFPPTVRIDVADGTVVTRIELTVDGTPVDRFDFRTLADIDGDARADYAFRAPATDGEPCGDFVVVPSTLNASTTLRSADLASLPRIRDRSGYDPTTGEPLAGCGAPSLSNTVDDLDGDGLDELVLFESNVRGDAATYVVFGTTAPGAVDLDALDGTDGFRLDGALSVVSAGDVDGDGLGDALVMSTIRPDRGFDMKILLGSANYPAARTFSAIPLGGESPFLLEGAGRVIPLGDFDGDGLDDLLVYRSVPIGRDAPVPPPDGDVGFVSGSSIRDAAGGAGLRLDGRGDLSPGGPPLVDGCVENPCDFAAAGDVDGNGEGDLLALAPESSGSDPVTYSAAVLYGGAAPLPVDGLADLSSSLFTTILPGAGDNLTPFDLRQTVGDGRTVSLGDLNGDGASDILYRESVLLGTPNGFRRQSIALAPLDGRSGFTLDTGITSSTFATDIDIDGDGFDDIVWDERNVFFGRPGDGPTGPVKPPTNPDPAPAAPTGLRATRYGAPNGELFWDRPADISLIDTWEIARDGEVIDSRYGLSLYTESLVIGVAHEFTVTAIGKNGRRSEPARIRMPARVGSVTADPSTPGGAPAAPSGLRGAIYSATALELFWQRPANPGLRYEIGRDGTTLAVIDGLSYTDMARATGESRYAVVTIDREGRRSAPATLTVRSDGSIVAGGGSDGAPEPPTGLRSATYSATAAELFWERVPTPGLRYEVSREGRVIGTREGTSYFDDTIEGGFPLTYTIVTIAPDGTRSVPSAPITVHAKR